MESEGKRFFDYHDPLPEEFQIFERLINTSVQIDYKKRFNIDEIYNLINDIAKKI